MQIVLGILFVLIVILIFLYKSDSINTKTKGAMILFIVVVIASAFLYEFIFSKKQQSNREIVNSYKQGKTITCKGVDINLTTFTFEPGTLSFMAKREIQEIAGTIYDIKDCSIKR